MNHPRPFHPTAFFHSSLPHGRWSDSFLLENHNESHEFFLGDNEDLFFKKIEDALNAKLYLSFYLTYEIGMLWQGLKTEEKGPLMGFSSYKTLNSNPLPFIKSYSSSLYKPFLYNERNLLSKEAYLESFTAIKNAIQEGNTYQVNLTFPKSFQFEGNLFELYLSLCSEQKVKFGGYFEFPSLTALSFSPELFFEKKADLCTLRPMKGTLLKKDLSYKNAKAIFATDEKNKAENLMIVDLMRNDLTKISQVGSVRVPQLFSTESYKTLYQMTSTIKSTIKPNFSLKTILKNLFPSGSITGAPKKRTMEIIQGQEPFSRRLYTGALGFLSLDRMIFNIPIRTLYSFHNPSIPSNEKEKKRLIFGTGSGITYLAQPEEEYEECLSKSSFLKKRIQTFEIIETWGPISNVEKHLERMKASALFFSYPFPEDLFRSLVSSFPKGLFKYRLTLNSNGELKSEVTSLSSDIAALLSQEQNRTSLFISLSSLSLPLSSPFLNHKTTYRPWYHLKMPANVFDTIVINQKGELTEGTKTNFFIKKKDILITPPLSSGLLSGIVRQTLLEEKKAREEILKPSDLLESNDIFISNSVIGLQKASLIPSARKDFL